MKNRLLYIMVFVSMLMAGCQDTDDFSSADGNGMISDEIIHVGGITTDELVATGSVTRTSVNADSVLKTDAENISWLVEPLKSGLDITYGLSSNRSGTSRVAILKLLTDEGGIIYSKDTINNVPYQYAEYSFKYRNNTTGVPTDSSAIWHGNGAHFFEGLYIPDNIKYNADTEDSTAVFNENGRAPYLTSDQHNDTVTNVVTGNYTLLSHYLGMPSNYTISATVARIKLPFRHRLARVLAYILIDPEMGDSVKIQGYKLTDGKDDPTTTKIKFCNVKVLAGVKDIYDEDHKHHTYTPRWTEIRKVIPHFVGERGSYNDRTNKSIVDSAFISFYDTNEKTYIYPDDTDWATINAKTFVNNKSSDGYERIIYGKVPVYDLIVRPTYTSLANVMYDEEGVSNATTRQKLYAQTNQIDFDITLNNGLQYEKRFTFDLNANYQTVVYLHISKERVDYNSSGSELWVTTSADDGYYGVNNQNKNTLSFAGSGWQRAYTNANPHFTDNITDGHYYKYDSEDEYAQYVTSEKWIEMFLQAYKGGDHHGDYFILKNDISIPASSIPNNFVFTGHLDGQNHTITVTSGTKKVVDQEAYDENTYVEYTDGEGAGITKYVQSGENWIEASGTYYQLDTKDNPENPDTYSEISDLTSYQGNIAYSRSGEEGSYTYTSVSFRKLVVVHHPEVSHNETVNPSYLLSGLNGNYTTAQESDATATWEANVHKEKYNSTEYWVPYKNDTNGDGWRAEVFNTTISGAALFNNPTYPPTPGATVTGYVHNCTDNNGTVTNYTPSIPEY